MITLPARCNEPNGDSRLSWLAPNLSRVVCTHLTLVVFCNFCNAAIAAEPETDTNINPAPFHSSIEAIERTHGAMDHRLSEHFLGLGLAHRANGDLDAAIDAFQQALHINRVNKGLHHLVHVPIVDLLIDVHASKSDWAAVEQQQRFRYWIHQREVDSQSDEFIQAALAFAAWETRAYDMETGLSGVKHLRDAKDALRKARTTVEQRYGEGHPELIEILHAEAAACMNLAVFLSDSAVDPATGGPTQGDDVSDAILRRNVIIENFQQGKSALNQVVEITDNDEQRIQHALALANVADWELVFERPQSASKNYRRARNILEDQGVAEQTIAREFDEPRAVRYFTTEPRPPIDTKDSDPSIPYVTIEFTVTKSGNVRRLKVIDKSSAATTRMVRNARSNLNATIFRPKIASTGPVEARRTIRYVYPTPSI